MSILLNFVESCIKIGISDSAVIQKLIELFVDLRLNTWLSSNKNLLQYLQNDNIPLEEKLNMIDLQANATNIN